MTQRNILLRLVLTGFWLLERVMVRKGTTVLLPIWRDPTLSEVFTPVDVTRTRLFEAVIVSTRSLSEGVDSTAGALIRATV